MKKGLFKAFLLMLTVILSIQARSKICCIWVHSITRS
jgi:hypothetical protein